MDKQLGIWVISQFCDIYSNSTSHETRILPQEMNRFNKYIIFVSKTKSKHWIHTVESIAWLELLSKTETWDMFFSRKGLTKCTYHKVWFKFQVVVRICTKTSVHKRNLQPASHKQLRVVQQRMPRHGWFMKRTFEALSLFYLIFIIVLYSQ